MSEVQWRRRWKPDFNSCPWQMVEIQGSTTCTNLLVKARFNESSYEFLATNLTEFWYELLEEHPFHKRSESLNPNIEAPLTRIIDQIKAGLESPDKDTKLTFSTTSSSGIVLKISSQLAGLPFIWSFKAESTEYDMGRDHLIIPLMTMVGELFRQQRELNKMLAAKDKQIDDYKAQGAQVTRKHLDTVRFDEVAFQNNMVASKGFEEEVTAYGDHAFSSKAQDLYRHMATKKAWLTVGDQDPDDVNDNDDRGQGAPSLESWANRLPSSMAQRNPSPNKASKTSPISPSKKSPVKSPIKTPTSSAESSPVKDTELLRRQALERKLEQEEMKSMEKAKKKKKLKL